MIVCICANISDSTIKQVSNFSTTLEDLRESLDVCNNCCCCYLEIITLLRDLKNE
jgi:bacterioferritin-associated ferredoxin